MLRLQPIHRDPQPTHIQALASPSLRYLAPPHAGQPRAFEVDGVKMVEVGARCDWAPEARHQVHKVAGAEHVGTLGWPAAWHGACSARTMPCRVQLEPLEPKAYSVAGSVHQPNPTKLKTQQRMRQPHDQIWALLAVFTRALDWKCCCSRCLCLCHARDPNGSWQRGMS